MASAKGATGIVAGRIFGGCISSPHLTYFDASVTTAGKASHFNMSWISTSFATIEAKRPRPKPTVFATADKNLSIRLPLRNTSKIWCTQDQLVRQRRHSEGKWLARSVDGPLHVKQICNSTKTIQKNTRERIIRTVRLAKSAEEPLHAEQTCKTTRRQPGTRR